MWLGLILAVVVGGAASPMHPAALRCEYRSNPIGIDAAKPRLSWTLESSRRGERQTAYQVLVCEDEQDLKTDHGGLWDSGKIHSDQTAQIVYAGKPLQS